LFHVKHSLLSFYTSKAYRHLSFFNIKQNKYINSLLYLSISTIFIRYISDKEKRYELIKKRYRGYAQLYFSANQIGTSNKYQNKYNILDKEINAFISSSCEPIELPNCQLNLMMIRHTEKQRDTEGKFGFDKNDTTTNNGNLEFTKLTNRMKQMISNKYDKVIIISSDLLSSNDCQLLKNTLKNLKPEVISEKNLNSINLGKFYGLKEDEAKNNFPGEYRLLTQYRTKQNSGFDLTFPNGENVLEFERRIALSFSKTILQYANVSNFDIEKILFIFLGHTSTITALLNILNYISNDDISTEPKYTFYSIDTSTIIHGKVDLKMHNTSLEISKEFVF
jgi:broad specificity phosphatase PhoE